MADSEFVKSKRIGRPPTGKGVPVLVRIPPEDVAALDWYIAEQHADDMAHHVKGAKPMTRPEAIRWLLQSSFENINVRMAKAAKRSRKPPPPDGGK